MTGDGKGNGKDDKASAESAQGNASASASSNADLSLEGILYDSASADDAANNRSTPTYGGLTRATGADINTFPSAWDSNPGTLTLEMLQKALEWQPVQPAKPLPRGYKMNQRVYDRLKSRCSFIDTGTMRLPFVLHDSFGVRVEIDDLLADDEIKEIE